MCVFGGSSKGNQTPSFYDPSVHPSSHFHQLFTRALHTCLHTPLYCVCLCNVLSVIMSIRLCQDDSNENIKNLAKAMLRTNCIDMPVSEAVLSAVEEEDPGMVHELITLTVTKLNQHNQRGKDNTPACHSLIINFFYSTYSHTLTYFLPHIHILSSYSHTRTLTSYFMSYSLTFTSFSLLTSLYSHTLTPYSLYLCAVAVH
jgi:hypothetical protein